ncbi:MAG: dihydropteroate synthase [Paracoccus sp. (in: a-proteobacteria)]|nr:dihydropteroate synthase [Paracoccus sp. (in: a-proteobacteria)]
MAERVYFRPVPDAMPPHDSRWRLAGGWLGFSRLEILRRNHPPQIVEDAPGSVLAALTAARAPVMGITMDHPRVMGIVNATPDSFSDGGQYDPAAQGLALIAQGADIVDIGGESTRPGAQEIDRVTEIARILPAIRTAVAARGAVSVDTRKAAVAAAALEAGAGMVNDVSGLTFDPDMTTLLARREVPLCLMHAQGLPADMQNDPRYDNALLDVYDALEAGIARAETAGIRRNRIVIDPGIGFGKTEAHNLAILRRISLYHGLGCPILLGVSRKRLIGSLSGAARPEDRQAGTLALTMMAVAQGVQIHRVHDVEPHVQALRIWTAMKNEA